MNTNRLSLSSPVFSGRIKKFDTYKHDPKKSARKVSRHDIAKSRPILRPAKRQTTSLHRAAGLKNHNAKSAVPRLLARNIARANKAELKNQPSDAVPPTHQLALSAVGSTVTTMQNDIEKQFSKIPSLSALTMRRKMNSAMYVIAAIVFILATTASIQTLIANQQNRRQVQGILQEKSANSSVDDQGVAQGTGERPAEASVPGSVVSSYQVSNPEHPRLLRIPELGLVSRIKELGEKNGAVDAPWNINDVGWFNGSAKPGNSIGSSLLLGHVSGWTASGVFNGIDTLQPGTLFEVEKGSGEVIAYEVVKSESLPVEEVNMGQVLSSEVAGEHDLKLMTCSGKYDRENDEYAERLTVYAKLVS